MSQIIFDTTDPAVAEMVKGWKEGGQYRAEFTFTQGKTTGSLIPAEINEVLDYGDADGAEAVEPEDGSEGGGMAPGDLAGLPSKKGSPGLRGAP